LYWQNLAGTDGDPFGIAEQEIDLN